MSAQKEFIEYYEHLKQNASEDLIYFGDSTHPQHQTRLAYGWIKKGVCKRLPSTAKQYRVNIIGGICLNGHRFVYQKVEKVNGASIKNFLKHLRQKSRSEKKIHIILDNAGYHKSKEVIEYAKSLRIELHDLPPYSPHLNPIERLWKIMHEEVTYNQYYEKFSYFSERIMLFLKTVGRKKILLRSRITDHFQLIPSIVPDTS